MPEPVLVVMAAGMGSRYGGLKQVDPVGPHGQTLMDYSLYDARRAGFTRVVFVISPAMAADFPSLIDARIGGTLDVRCAVQRLSDVPEGFGVPEGREKPWGTGHAVRACRALLDAPFAAINADDYYGPHAFETIYRFLKEARTQTPRQYAMVGYELPNTLSMKGHVARGICQTDANGSLVEILERTHVVWSSDGPLHMAADGTYRRLPEGAWASMNLWGFSADFSEALDRQFAAFLETVVPENPLSAEYFLPEVVGSMLRDATAVVRVLPSSDRWYGVTYRDDRPIVTEAIDTMTRAGLYPEKLW